MSSGMASTVIQVYLKSVLDSFVHPSVHARHATLKVIQLILAQGLVHPVQIVPYLICMATDIEQRISHTADRELQVKYWIQMSDEGQALYRFLAGFSMIYFLRISAIYFVLIPHLIILGHRKEVSRFYTYEAITRY